LAAAGLITIAHGLARFTLTLPYSTLIFPAEGEAWHVDVRHGYGDEIFSLFPDQLSVRNILAKSLSDSAANNVPKPCVVAVNL